MLYVSFAPCPTSHLMEVIANLHQQLSAANSELTELQRQTEELSEQIKDQRERRERRKEQHAAALTESQFLREQLKEESAKMQVSLKRLEQLEQGKRKEGQWREHELVQLLQRLNSRRQYQESVKDQIEVLMEEYLATKGWRQKTEMVQGMIASWKSLKGNAAMDLDDERHSLRRRLEAEQRLYDSCKLNYAKGLSLTNQCGLRFKDTSPRFPN